MIATVPYVRCDNPGCETEAFGSPHQTLNDLWECLVLHGWTRPYGLRTHGEIAHVCSTCTTMTPPFRPSPEALELADQIELHAALRATLPSPPYAPRG